MNAPLAQVETLRRISEGPAQMAWLAHQSRRVWGAQQKGLWRL